MVGNKLHTQEYLYDFAKDGGAQGTINLSAKAGMPLLPVGAIVKRVIAKVLTAFTSGGSATLAWGNAADPDGYSGAAIAVASLTANAVFNGYDNGAALLWDDTNDHQIDMNVAVANDQNVSVTIGTADMTAGKMSIMVEFYLPGQAA
jgi:hypothetical protein